MNEPANQVGVIQSGFSDIGYRCPVCGAAITRGKVIVGQFAPGTSEAAEFAPAHVLVCQAHLLPDWLLATSPRLMHDSARGVVERIVEREQLARGERPPSLRRSAIRTRLPPAANELGRFGFIDRLLGLLAELCVRVLNAGERAAARPDAAARAARIGRDPSRRGESEVRVS